MLPGNAGEHRLHLGDGCLFVALVLALLPASAPARTIAVTNIALIRMVFPFRSHSFA
jgi:hypothetical protein